MTCVVQCTVMKGSVDTTAFGWWWPGIPRNAHTRHARLDLPQVQEKGKGRRKENAWSSLHLDKRRSRDRENIADDGHCNIRGIGKVHQIITMPNKPNDARAYSSNVLHAIISHNHLPLLKIFSSFVHFFPNFQIFCLFSTFLCHFSQKSLPMPLLYKIGPGCTY